MNESLIGTVVDFLHVERWGGHGGPLYGNLNPGPEVAVHHKRGVAELPMLLHPRGAVWLTKVIKMMRKGRMQEVRKFAKL